jgi:RNase H-like domain found in reverse transcriptase
LGHIISNQGVATDLKKIEAMLNWSFLKTVKQLRGFLGLTCYYRKPLTDLLRKDSFKWSTTAQLAFDTLKQAMSQAPILSLLNFSKPFIVETDASQFGIGAVLMEDKQPLAFLSKKLGPKNQDLSTYEKELLALITAVIKWRHYLIGSPFVIKTDQINLKNLLEQRINTAMQHRGLSKLLGLDYTIVYKKGIDNKVVDALYRIEGQSCPLPFSNGSLCAVSEIISQWVQDISQSYSNDTWISSLFSTLQLIPTLKPHLTLHQGLFRWK